MAGGKELLVTAVPSNWAGETAKSLKGIIGADTAVLNLAKGFDPETLERLSVIIARNAGHPVEKMAVLSGPNHAEEVIRMIPSAAVIASVDRELAGKLQSVVSTPYFRAYTNCDVCGVEVGAACKNVLAIAAGVVDGMGLGDNSKASLVTRGSERDRSIRCGHGRARLDFLGPLGYRGHHGDLLQPPFTQPRPGREDRGGHDPGPGNGKHAHGSGGRVRHGHRHQDRREAYRWRCRLPKWYIGPCMKAWLPPKPCGCS